MTYNIMNYLISSKDSKGSVTNYTYYPTGKLKNVIDANNNITQFFYDERERLIKTINPLGKVTLLERDGNGNIIKRTTPNGDVISYEYDRLDKVTKRLINGEEDSTFIYNQSSQDLINFRNATSVYSRTYYERTLTEEKNTILNHHSSLIKASPQTFYLNNNTIKTEFNLGDLGVNYTISPNYLEGEKEIIGQVLKSKNIDRVSLNVSHFKEETTYTKDKLSQRIMYKRFDTAASPIITNFDYDSNLLAKIQYTKNESTILEFLNEFDSNGNRTQTTVSSPAIPLRPVINYTYDETNQLESSDHPLSSKPKQSFTYDALGNRTNNENIIGPGNQLLENSLFKFSYDSNGNLIKKENKQNAEVTYFIYNPLDQLIKVEKSANSSSPKILLGSYEYDSIGRRISRTTNEGKSYFAYIGI